MVTSSAVELENLRAEIDRCDEKIHNLVARRTEVAREIGRLKRTLGRPTLDQSREAEVLALTVGRAQRLGLNPELLLRLQQDLMALARSAQEAVLEETDATT